MNKRDKKIVMLYNLSNKHNLEDCYNSFTCDKYSAYCDCYNLYDKDCERYRKVGSFKIISYNCHCFSCGWLVHDKDKVYLRYITKDNDRKIYL